MYSKRRDTTDHHAVRCAGCIDALHRPGRLVAPHLAAATLDRANLTGVLWSEQTTWPAAMRTVMHARSEQVRPGLWRVIGCSSAKRGSGHAFQAREVMQ
jgi:hypothetical protein